MAFVVLSIIGFIAVLLVNSVWSPKKQVAFVLIFLCIGLVMYLFFTIVFKTDIIKGPSGVLTEIPWLEIFLYFIMLLGMASKYLFDAIGKSNKITFQKWQLIRPILVSPIVFGLIYSNLGDQSNPVLLYIFSFQNGFFWQSVLKK